MFNTTKASDAATLADMLRGLPIVLRSQAHGHWLEPGQGFSTPYTSVQFVNCGLIIGDTFLFHLAAKLPV